MSSGRLAVVFLIVVVLAASAVAQDTVGSVTDDILSYYWSRAVNRTTEIEDAQGAISYILTARSFYRHVNSEGEITKTDTLLAEYYLTGNVLDSQVVLAGNAKRFTGLAPIVPNIFEHHYHLNLFPNDTGGTELAIGITSDSADTRQPDGLLVIGRLDFLPRWMYLYYPGAAGFDRLTRSFRIQIAEGLLVPDSIWEVGTRHGILTSENYRLETGITDVRLLP